MKEFIVTITETLERKVAVEAETEQDAYDKVQEMYDSQGTVLTAEDFIGVDFNIFEENQ